MILGPRILFRYMAKHWTSDNIIDPFQVVIHEAHHVNSVNSCGRFISDSINTFHDQCPLIPKRNLLPDPTSLKP